MTDLKPLPQGLALTASSWHQSCPQSTPTGLGVLVPPPHPRGGDQGRLAVEFYIPSTRRKAATYLESFGKD